MKSKVNFQLALFLFFLGGSLTVFAQPGADRPDKPDKVSIGDRSNKASSEKASPSDKGTCKEWERPNFSDHERVTKEHETTRAQCERIDKQAKEAVGDLAGAKFEPAQKVESSTKSEKSNCDLPNPTKKTHRLPDQ